MLITLANVVSVLTLLPWAVTLFFSIFLFDSPEATYGAVAIMLLVLVYPAMVVGCIVVSRRTKGRVALVWALTPIVLAVLVGLVFYVAYSYSAKKVQEANRAVYVQATKDFVCKDGSFIHKDTSEFFEDFQLFTNSTDMPIELARVTKEGNVGSLVQLHAHAADILNTMETCVDNAEVTFPRAYPSVWQELQISVKK